VLGAGLKELLDHGMVYRLSALRTARAEQGRLVLVDHGGHEVFADVEVNGKRVMDDFAPVEATLFAAVLRREIKEQAGASRRAR
jgi:hypothetical protein